MTRFWIRHRTTLIALAAAAAALALAFVLWTPLCLWTVGSATECRRLTCEVVAMRRPHADHGWCEAWFERFRSSPLPRMPQEAPEPGAVTPPVD